MAAFAARLPEWLAAHAPDVIAKLEHSGEMDAASRAALKNAIQSLANEFTAGQEEGNAGFSETAPTFSYREARVKGFDTFQAQP
jgi:hypothetical protein